MGTRKIVSLITVLFVCLCIAGYILPGALEKASAPEPILPEEAGSSGSIAAAETEAEAEPPRRQDEPSPGIPEMDLPKALQRQPDTGFIWIEHDPDEKSTEITPFTPKESLLPAEETIPDAQPAPSETEPAPIITLTASAEPVTPEPTVQTLQPVQTAEKPVELVSAEPEPAVPEPADPAKEWRADPETPGIEDWYVDPDETETIDWYAEFVQDQPESVTWDKDLFWAAEWEEAIAAELAVK